MREFWCYDWEVYSNFACVTFIYSTTPKHLIDAYVEVDIRYLKVKSLISESDDFSLYEDLDKLKKAKASILTMMNAKTFFIYDDVRNNGRDSFCQLGELLMFFTNHKVLMGYNSFNYDSYITDYVMIHGNKYNPVTGKSSDNIHITTVLKQVSDEVISVSKSGMYYHNYSWKPKYYKRLFEDYDIQKILYLDSTFTGLKSVAINLKWHRIQELPIHHTYTLDTSNIYDMYDYNVNDVLITFKLAWNQEEEVTLREEISKRYEVNVLNESRSSIGKRLMSKYYEESSGISYRDFKDTRTHRGKMKLDSIISNRIKFETPLCKDFLKSLLTSIITPDTNFERQIKINNTLYTIAKGGIHSIDDSHIYNDTDGYIYRDADVTSYYPSIIEIFKISPKHLIKDIFLYLISYFKNDRVRAKKAGFKLEAEALKIVINRIYGALRDINDYLFDPKATYQTTFNGQLSLLMLIEKLELNGISVISANTDGIVARFKPSEEELYVRICKEWEQETGFELEYTDYERYIRNNVNEYVAIKKGFKEKYNLLHKISETYDADLKDLEDKYIKAKGDFITETPFNKGFVHPVVSLALRQYVVYDIPYDVTIKEHWKKHRFNIYDYCMSQKVDKKFTVTFSKVIKGEIVMKELQQYNRFYVVATGGGSITKKDMQVVNSSTTSLLAGKRVEIFNDFIEKEDYNIDFKFYISQVEKYLYFRKKNTRGNHKLEGFIARSNNLFENEQF